MDKPLLENRAIELHNVTAVVGFHDHVEIHYPFLFLFVNHTRATDSLEIY